MRRINLGYTTENNKYRASLRYNSVPYLLILATAASLIFGAQESLPKLRKGYTKSEIEESLKEKRGNFTYLTYPGRACMYFLYNLSQKRTNLEENSLSQIIEET